MKTKRTGLRFLKNLVMITSVALVAMSCGKQNTSGQSNNSVAGFGQVGNYGSFGGMDSSQILLRVSQENPCRSSGQYGNQQVNGTQRVQTQVQIQGVNINVGSVHIGVSTYGDIAVMVNRNGQAVADLYVCPRDNSGASASQANAQVRIANDPLCPLAKIDAATFTIQSQAGQLPFGIAPIHIPGTDRISSLCQ